MTLQRSTLLLFLSALLYCHRLAAQSAGSRDTIRLSLQQCVETAIQNNADVQKKGLQKQAAHINWVQAKENMLPSLNAEIYHGTNQGRSIDPYTNSYINQQLNYANYNLYTDVTLFQGLALQHSIQQNRLAYDASTADEQQQKDNLTLNVIMAYLQILTNEDLLALAYQQQEVSARQVERLDIKDKDGAADPKELYDLKGQLANDQLTVVTTQNNLENAKLTLAQLMNLPYTQYLAVQRITTGNASQLIYDAGVQDVYQRAESSLAIVKAADLRRQSATAGIQAAKSNGWPVVFLSGGVATNYSSAGALQTLTGTRDEAGNDYIEYNGTRLPVIEHSNTYVAQKIPYSQQLDKNLNTTVSLGVRIPLLNNLQNKNKIAQARLIEQDAAITAKTVRIQLQQNVEQSYFNMTAAQNKYKVLQQQQTAFRESFRVAEVKFDAGAINSVDYIVAKNNYDRSNINMVVAGYDLVIRIKLLDYYQGKALW